MIECWKLLILAEEWDCPYNEKLVQRTILYTTFTDQGIIVLLLVFVMHFKFQMFLANISSNQILKLLMLVKTGKISRLFTKSDN